MKNYFNSTLFVATILAFLAMSVIPVHAEFVNGGDDVAIPASDTTNNGNDDVQAPVSQITNGDDDVQASGNTTNNGSDDVSPITSETSNGNDDINQPASPQEPVNPPVVPPSNPGGGSTYSSGGRSSISVANVTSCPLLTTFMRMGADNDKTEVTKLQIFLKNVEKLDVDVNGIFDQKTYNAVIAFQTKYSEVTLAPWCMNQPCGFVYITTLKKINQLACNMALTLSPSELAIINSYKDALANGLVPASENTETVDSNTGGTELGPKPLEIGTEASDEQTDVAGAGEASVWNRIISFFGSIWSFIKNIFG